MVHAYILVQTEVGKAAEVAAAIAEISGVTQAEDVTGLLGVMVGGVIARGFFVSLSIFGVGMINGDAGASAGFLFLAAFTVYFTMALVLRPLNSQGRRR